MPGVESLRVFWIGCVASFGLVGLSFINAFVVQVLPKNYTNFITKIFSLSFIIRDNTVIHCLSRSIRQRRIKSS